MTTEEFINTRYLEEYNRTKPGQEYPVYPPEYLIPIIEEYARIKCLEAIRDTRYQAIDIITHHIDTQFNLPVEENDVHDLIRDIQNIPNQDVMPEL